MDKNPNILIKEALYHSIEEINKGAEPTAALKKAAEYHDLNYEFIQRTGEALNTALHYSHFKTASDKAANFPIADIKKVVNDLYSENEKTANHFTSEQFVSSELFNPIPDLDKIFTSPKHKEAYIKISSAPKDVKAPLSPKAVLEKSSNYIREMEKQLTNAQVKEAEAKLNLDASFFNLADSFKKDAAYRTSFDEFESQTYSRFGEKAVPYLDLIHKHANLSEDRGIHDSGYIMFEDCTELKKFSKFLDYVDNIGGIQKEAEDAQHNLNYEKEYIDNIYKSASELKKKFEDVPVESKMASVLTDVLKQVQEHMKGEQKKNPGPQSDHAMDMFEQQAILQDLLIRDPVLSKENPHSVISAYEQIVRLSPNVAKERDVVRALLRNMTAGQALATHGAGQLSELETSLLKQRSFASGNTAKL